MFYVTVTNSLLMPEVHRTVGETLLKVHLVRYELCELSLVFA